MPLWTLHGDGRTVPPGEVIAPDERLAWPRMFGVAGQHVVAMFGGTFLVPVLTGFPPATTLLFSGIGTLLFALITQGRVPSYLGSSFAFIAPVLAATADGGYPTALGGIVVVGLVVAVVGLSVSWAGPRWVERVLPPLVTGTIVALIGFNLAPTAAADAATAPVTATVTLVVTLLAAVFFRGFLGRLSVLVGVAVGYAFALTQGQLDTSELADAPWLGFPTLTSPTFSVEAAVLFLPLALVLVAENVGHVKAVAAMTGRDLDGVMGRAILADGLSTTVAGMGGGSGTTTYAENIGVMAATRVYSSLAYVLAGAFAVLLSMSPKVGAFIATIPDGVLGGVTLVLFGLIGVLGARIWVSAGVDLTAPVNLMTAAVGLTLGIANVTLVWGSLTFTGIAVGTVATVIAFHVLTGVTRWRGTGPHLPAPSDRPAPSADTPASGPRHPSGGDPGRGERM